jgi:hypothetical protein
MLYVATLVAFIHRCALCYVLRACMLLSKNKSFSIFEKRAVHHWLLSHVYRMVNIDFMYRVGAYAGRL